MSKQFYLVIYASDSRSAIEYNGVLCYNLDKEHVLENDVKEIDVDGDA